MPILAALDNGLSAFIRNFHCDRQTTGLVGKATSMIGPLGYQNGAIAIVIKPDFLSLVWIGKAIEVGMNDGQTHIGGIVGLDDREAGRRHFPFVTQGSDYRSGQRGLARTKPA